MIHIFKEPHQQNSANHGPVFLRARELVSLHRLRGLAPRAASRYVARACSFSAARVRMSVQVVVERLAGERARGQVRITKKIRTNEKDADK